MNTKPNRQTGESNASRVGDYATIKDCGDYWRIKWLEDGAISTTSKSGMPTRSDVTGWIKYTLNLPSLIP